MSKEFDNLVSRVTCQMEVMLRERKKFRVLGKELRTFIKKDIASKKRERAWPR